MRLLGLPPSLIDKFIDNVVQASQGLKEHEHLPGKLERCANVVLKRENEELMSLLKDKSIQNRIMSKLIGGGD